MLSYRKPRTFRPYGYVINRKTLEVHSYDCPHLPTVNRLYLGCFGSLRQATEKAKCCYNIFANPCDHCERRENRRRLIRHLLGYS